MKHWLDQIASDKRIVVLHPNAANTHQMVGDVALSPDAIYVRFEGDALHLGAIQEQFERAIQLDYESVVRENLQTIVLDECDRTRSEAFGEFVQSLITTLSARIIIATRTVPQTILADTNLAPLVQFWPVDEGMMLHEYHAMNSDQDLLEVYALGSGHVRLNGQPITEWDGHLPRSLFFFLVDHGMVTRDRIFATFWAGMNPSDATNVFHVTKRKVNEILGIDLMAYSAGFYRISPNIELRYDVTHFNQMVQSSAMAEPDEEIHQLERALMIYRGKFLNGLSVDWAVQRRDKLQQSAIDVLLELADAYQRQGHDEQALTHYLRASTLNLYREDIVREILRLSIKTNRQQVGIRAFERLEHVLSETVGIPPNRELRELLAQATQ